MGHTNAYEVGEQIVSPLCIQKVTIYFTIFLHRVEIIQLCQAIKMENYIRLLQS